MFNDVDELMKSSSPVANRKYNVKQQRIPSFIKIGSLSLHILYTRTKTKKINANRPKIPFSYKVVIAMLCMLEKRNASTV